MPPLPTPAIRCPFALSSLSTLLMLLPFPPPSLSAQCLPLV